MPGTLDVALDAAGDGVILPEFLLVADTLDELGVERKRPLRNEGGKEDDTGTNGELETVGAHQRREDWQEREFSPSDPLQTTPDIPMYLEVLVDDVSKDGAQYSVHGDIRGVQEGHYSTKSRDVDVFGSCRRLSMDPLRRRREMTYNSYQ
jgi:hypothetical protein